MRNGNALYFFALYSLYRFAVSIPLFSLDPIVFVDPAETGNHLALPRFYNEIVQPFFKFGRTFPRRIDIGNANAFVALRERLIIFPCGGVGLYRIQNIFREHIRRTDEIDHTFPNLRMNHPLPVKPDKALYIRARIRTARLSRREMLCAV